MHATVDVSKRYALGGLSRCRYFCGGLKVQVVQKRIGDSVNLELTLKASGVLATSPTSLTGIWVKKGNSLH